MCWQLVGRVSAVKGVKYARVFIVQGFFFHVIPENPVCDKAGKREASARLAQSTLHSI